MVQAKPALDDASALKPRCCKAFALPTSTGLGRMKQPLSCSFLKVARLSAVVTCMFLSLVWPRRDGDVPPRALVRVVHRAAVLWRLLAIIHAVVADDAGDTQVIIGEDFRAA